MDDARKDARELRTWKLQEKQEARELLWTRKVRKPSDVHAKKARLVWLAAFPQSGPLTDDVAVKRGVALEKAAEWYIIASSRRPEREHRAQKSIALTATKLLRLLSENPELVYRIEQFASFDLDWLASLKLQLTKLRDAAKEAQNHRGGAEVLCQPKLFGSPQGIFISRLKKIYFEFSGNPPGRSVNRSYSAKKQPPGPKYRVGGPFSRFVIAAAEQFDIPKPSLETISQHLKHGHSAAKKS